METGMAFRLHPKSGSLVAALTLSLTVVQGTAAEAETFGFYDVTDEMQMPHLDENLRYATRHYAECVDRRWFAAAFASLRYNALSDCTLEHEREQGATLSYELLCTGGHGTTGAATWRLDGDRIVGRLNVTLGGKNMTFSEQISARRLGDCAKHRLGDAIDP
jgi:hypothetical protein